MVCPAAALEIVELVTLPVRVNLNELPRLASNAGLELKLTVVKVDRIAPFTSSFVAGVFPMPRLPLASMNILFEPCD